jgi:dienelactone hydrolase
VPKRFNPPYQAVVMFSGIQDFLFDQSSADIEPGFAALPLDYIVKSGRVFVHPVYQGSYERLKAPYDPSDGVRNTRESIQRRWDLGRTLDYLETRPDIDATRVAYVGVSFGASIALPLVATETRFKAAVFLSGGLASPRPGALIEGVNHAPRITIPTLMINGRFDELFPLETSQKPLFQLLGTPPEHKRHVVFESGHGSPPRAETLRETLGWLDTYLGPVR